MPPAWIIGSKGRNKLFKLSKTPSHPSIHYAIIPIGAKPLSSSF